MCTDPRFTSDLADWLLAKVHRDLERMAAHIGLNNENCFFQMTENFVKVVKITQIIEEFKEELMQVRKAKEEALKEAEKAKQWIAELEKELVQYKKV